MFRFAVAVNTAGAVVATWLPNPNFYVYSMSLSGTTVYMGGLFGTMGGQPRQGLAAVDATNGALAPWAPAGFNIGQAITVVGTTVFAGGHLMGGAKSVAAYHSVSAAVLWSVEARSVSDFSSGLRRAPTAARPRSYR